MPKSRTIFVLVCLNKGCRQHNREWITIAPIRDVDLYDIKCSGCGHGQTLKRVTPLEPNCELAKALDKEGL